MTSPTDAVEAVRQVLRPGIASDEFVGRLIAAVLDNLPVALMRNVMSEDGYVSAKQLANAIRAARKEILGHD